MPYVIIKSDSTLARILQKSLRLNSWMAHTKENSLQQQWSCGAVKLITKSKMFVILQDNATNNKLHKNCYSLEYIKKKKMSIGL